MEEGMEEAVVMEAEVEDTEEVGMAGDMVIILTNVIYFKYAYDIL